MRQRTRTVGGLSAVFAFLCALLIGVYSIASSNDYKGMVDSVLGGASAKAGSMEAYAYTSDYESLDTMLAERVRIAEQLGEEGCVLLKNDGALPVGTSKKVTVLGNRPYTYKSDGSLRDTKLTFYGGITGSVIYEQKVTIKTEDGKKTINSPVTLETAFAEQGIIINPAMRSFYSSKSYSPFPAGSEAADSAGGAYSIDEPKVSLNDTGNYSAYSDACFVVIGRTSGEGRDYLPGSSGVTAGSTQKSAIGLSNEERALIDIADQISHGKVVVLVNSAVAMEIEELKNDERVNSILWIGLPGSYGMSGVARVISGKASPSGHLSDTYAVTASNAPAARNFGDGDPDGVGKFAWSDNSYTAANNGHYVVMAEGIYTGYYYYETRYNDSVLDAAISGRKCSNAAGTAGSTDGVSWKYEDEVSYAFGYGLSYSTFTQSIVPDSFVYDEAENTVSIDVKVTNSENGVPAKDVVMLFVQTPFTEYDVLHGIEKSAIQLVTFAKTSTLAAGASETVTLTADIKYFASYDKTIRHDGVTGGYILENGNYYFAIGNGAHEALNNVLANCVGIDESKLYIEDGSAVNPNGTYKWEIAKQKTQVDKIDAFSFDESGVDSSYFARSESGVLVQNQMPDTDYNYFVKDTVTYLSRTDWQGTYPKSYIGLTTNAAMGRYLASNASSYEFSQSGTVSDYVRFGVDHSEEEDDDGNPLENTDIASYKGKAYDDPDWDYLLSQITFDEAWQFAPLGGTKCEAFRSVNAPEVWQIDGPNGNVNRGYNSLAPTSGFMKVDSSDSNGGYKSADMPCEPMVAATFNAELVAEEGDIFAEDTLWSRNPIMWAPGMNLHRTSFNSRNHEYYSEDPMLTNILGTAFVRAGVAKGAILSAKHFAFNSQESYREGLCQFFEEQSGRELELRAFQGLCEDVKCYIEYANNTIDALGLMSSFSRVGVQGANGHTGMMKNILRGEWGFKGLISTDMVSRTGFFNPQDCVANNVTFMATSSGESFLASSEWSNYNNKALVKSCPDLMNGLYENMHYYMYAIANSSALNGYAPGDVITDSMSWWQTLLINVTITFGVFAVVLLVLAIVLVFVKLPQKRDKAAAASESSASTDRAVFDAGGGSVEQSEQSPPPEQTENAVQTEDAEQTETAEQTEGAEQTQEPLPEQAENAEQPQEQASEHNAAPKGKPRTASGAKKTATGGGKKSTAQSSAKSKKTVKEHAND